MKKKNLIGILLGIIIIIGIILTTTIGLNLDLMYSSHKSIDINLQKQFENEDVYKIAKEVFENQKVKVQKVELYEDMVSIIVKDATDEQLENLNTKLNEKYELENKKDDMVITNVPSVEISDLVKPYILPVSISFVVIIVYLVIYMAINNRVNRKLSILKETSKAILAIIGIELLYLSVFAITRLEINYTTLPIGVIIYAFTTILILMNLEKQYKIEEKKK